MANKRGNIDRGTKAQRISLIKKMMGEGYSRTEIIDQLTREWDLSEAMLAKYLQWVYKLLEQEWTNDGFHTNLYQMYVELYKKAIRENDHKQAKAVLDSINKYFKGETLDVTSGGDKIQINIQLDNDND